MKCAAASGRLCICCLADGSVVTWGNPSDGGDSSQVQDQLRAVKQIQGTKHGAFAAILRDRSVVTWGKPNCGGDSSAVQVQLRHVEQIHAADVVAWGHELYGGDCSAV